MIVSDCPCGSSHTVADRIWASYVRVVAGLPATVDVKVPGRGTWRVPRIYIACHTVRGIEVPGLASRYGWLEVTG